MSGLIKIFTSPGELFEDIREGRVSWWPGLVAYILVVMLLSVLTIQLIGYDNIVRNSMEASGVLEKMGPEQRDKVMASALSPGRRNFSYVAGSAGALVVALIISGVLTGILFMLDRKIPFKKMLAAISYSLFAVTLFSGTLAVIVLLLLDDRASVNPENLVPLNLGPLLSREGSGAFLHSLGSSIDLFSFAIIGLIAFAITKLEPRTKMSVALTVVVGPWLVWVIAKSVASAIFSRMMG